MPTLFALDTSSHGNLVLYKEARSWVPVPAPKTLHTALSEGEAYRSVNMKMTAITVCAFVVLAYLGKSGKMSAFIYCTKLVFIIIVAAFA